MANNTNSANSVGSDIGQGAATGTAIEPGIGTAIGAVGGGVLGLLQSAQGNATEGQANNDYIQANQILQQLQQAPDISKPLILAQYQQQGILTPGMESIINAQMPGAIQTAQQYTNAQNNALSLMTQRANGGMTAGDRAALTQAQQQVQQGTQGQLGAIQQQLAQQGMSNSGTNLAMQLSAAQNGANQQANNANSLAQQQQNTRDQAAAQLGSYGSSLQAQQFGQAAQQQAAQQQMQRFNVQNQLGVQQANTQAANAAQAANLANKQQLSNQNVSQQNAQQNLQNQNALQQYQANGMSGLGNQQMGYGQDQAQAGYNSGVGLGNAAGSLANAFGNGSFTNSNNNTTPGFTASDAANLDSSAGYNRGGPVHDYRSGGSVPGKAPVNGDSPHNDIVQARLSPGEIVLPRTLADSKIGKEILKLIHAHNSVKNRMNGND